MKKIIIREYNDKSLLMKKGVFSEYNSDNKEVLSGGPPKVLWCHSTSVGAESWEWELWYYDEEWVKIDESSGLNMAVFSPPTIPGTYYIKLTINGTTTKQSEPFTIEFTPVCDFAIQDNEATWPPPVVFHYGSTHANHRCTGATSWLWEVALIGGGDAPYIPPVYFTTQDLTVEQLNSVFDLAGGGLPDYVFKITLTINDNVSLTLTSDYLQVIKS
jgi:hypothetical protein